MVADRDTFLKRQRVLGDFGELAMRSDNLQEILDEACRLVAEALDTDLTKILQIERDGTMAVVRAGYGWDAGVVGTERIQFDDHSSESYALKLGRPVITQDIAEEARFRFPPFMNAHGVIALVNTPILLPGGKVFGLLQVDARERRTFKDEDIEFLRTYCMVLGPVIDRLQTVGRLGQSDERFRLVVEHALDHAIILSDPDDIIVGWFPGSAAIFGWTEEEMIGRPVATIFTPEDRASEAPRWEVERARENGVAPNVRWHVGKDGRRVFLDGQTIAMRDKEGTLLGFLKMSQDVTERRRAEERQSVLQAELQHRVRNVLAMISSVVSRADVRGTAEELKKVLSGRIAAMARTQVLLTRSEGVGGDLEGMIRDELLVQSAGEHAVVVSGPSVRLAPKAAEVLTLGVHELVTNAAKYGALRHPEGRIDVSWRCVAHDGQEWLELDWRESGVDVEPTTQMRRGFGTELIVRRVPYELHGRGEMALQEGGLHCHISFPLMPGDSVLQTDVPSSARTKARTQV